MYIASTYLRVLTRRNDALRTSLEQALGEDALAFLEQDFIYGDDIDRIFTQFATNGLDSWVLQYGKDLTIASHGPVGFAVLSAPNLEAAIQVLIDYTIVRTSAYQFKFFRDGNRAQCILIDKTGGGLTGRWLTENGMRMVQQLIENVLAHSLGDNTAIGFTYSTPTYQEELNSLFGTRCEFGAKENSISFPASWCQISSPLSDEETFKTNLAKCHELKLTLTGFERFDEVIALALSTYFDARRRGKVTNEQMPSLESLAQTHHISSRTLNRRLKKQQTSYKSLLEDVRKEQASYLLQNTHLTIADIAYNLAYQEPANFVRAFKKWFDTPPSRWRRQRTGSNHTVKSNNER